MNEDVLVSYADKVLEGFTVGAWFVRDTPALEPLNVQGLEYRRINGCFDVTRRLHPLVKLGDFAWEEPSNGQVLQTRQTAM
jgi:hypothetical protein